MRNSEYRLKQKLFSFYKREVRPVINDKDAVDLKLEIGLQQIISVVSLNQAVHTETGASLGNLLHKVVLPTRHFGKSHRKRYRNIPSEVFRKII